MASDLLAIQKAYEAYGKMETEMYTTGSKKGKRQPKCQETAANLKKYLDTLRLKRCKIYVWGVGQHEPGRYYHNAVAVALPPMTFYGQPTPLAILDPIQNPIYRHPYIVPFMGIGGLAVAATQHAVPGIFPEQAAARDFSNYWSQWMPDPWNTAKVPIYGCGSGQEMFPNTPNE